MKKKILHDISLNSLQVIINQVSGVLIFYILSNQLNKESFGEINWSSAVLITVFTVLGAGIDQLTIKKIAAGDNNKKMLEIYLCHVLITGIGFYLPLLGLSFIFPAFFTLHSFLIAFGLSQIFVYFSTPFKQIAIGKEAFKTLFILSVSSNIIRVLGLVLIVSFSTITASHIIYLYIFSSLVELIICVLAGSRLIKVPLSLKWHKIEYRLLLKESLPLLGSIIFNSGLARLDWILLGIFSSSIVLAEYSFAYKVFEVSTLPLIIIAPLLIPRFTRFFRDTAAGDLAGLHKKLLFIAKSQLMLSWMLALILNVAWVPVIDYITNNKYGEVNSYTILILSCAMPFIYMNNIMWTVNLVQGRLKLIFLNITLTFIINITMNIILIPIIQGRGAAIAYLVAMIFQALHFTFKTDIHGLKSIWKLAGYYFLTALLCSLTAFYIFTNLWLQLLLAISLYIIIMFLTRQIQLSDRLKFKEITGL